MAEAHKVEQELLPCPFCGAADGRIEQAYVRATDDLEIWTVECLDCGAAIADDESQAAADRHWNTRATLTEPERTAKAVAEAVAAERERCAIRARDAMCEMEWPPNDGDWQVDQVMTAIRDEGAGG